MTPKEVLEKFTQLRDDIDQVWATAEVLYRQRHEMVESDHRFEGLDTNLGATADVARRKISDAFDVVSCLVDALEKSLQEGEEPPNA